MPACGVTIPVRHRPRAGNQGQRTADSHAISYSGRPVPPRSLPPFRSGRNAAWISVANSCCSSQPGVVLANPRQLDLSDLPAARRLTPRIRLLGCVIVRPGRPKRPRTRYGRRAARPWLLERTCQAGWRLSVSPRRPWLDSAASTSKRVFGAEAHSEYGVSQCHASAGSCCQIVPVPNGAKAVD